MTDIHIVYRKAVENDTRRTLGEPRVILVTDDEALAKELLRVQEDSGRTDTTISRYMNTFRLNELQIGR